MAICPKCNKEIEELNIESSQVSRGTYDGEEVEWDYMSFGDIEEKFFCPECGEELFDDRDEAEDFLDGK